MPRVRLDRTDDRQGADLQLANMKQGDRTSMVLNVVSARHSYGWLLAGLALSLAYLVGFRSLVKADPSPEGQAAQFTVAASGPEFLYYPVFIPLGSLITNTAKTIPGLENVQLALELKGRDLDEGVELLERVGLGERLRNYPKQLSGGESGKFCDLRGDHAARSAPSCPKVHQ